MALAKDLSVIRIGSDGLARFSFGTRATVVEGGARVAQVYLMALLTRSGSIFGSPNYGASLLDLAPATVSDEGELKTKVSAAVSKAQDDVIREQNQLILEPADRLSSVGILKMEYVPEERLMYMTLEIVNEAGSSIIVGLG